MKIIYRTGSVIRDAITNEIIFKNGWVEFYSEYGTKTELPVNLILEIVRV